MHATAVVSLVVALVATASADCSPLNMSLYPGSSLFCNGFGTDNVCTLSCPPGKRLVGNNVLSCNLGGHWLGACGYECTDWYNFGAFNYYNFNLQTNQVAAEKYCQSQGGHLASVHSTTENNFIATLLPTALNARWVGALRDRSGSSVKPFTWTWTDGTPFDIFESYYPSSAGGYGGCWADSAQKDCCTPNIDCLWATGNLSDTEPNDFRVRESCIAISFPSLFWIDVNCTRNYSFVCKRSVGTSGPYCHPPPVPVSRYFSLQASSFADPYNSLVHKTLVKTRFKSIYDLNARAATTMVMRKASFLAYPGTSADDFARNVCFDRCYNNQQCSAVFFQSAVNYYLCYTLKYTGGVVVTASKFASWSYALNRTLAL